MAVNSMRYQTSKGAVKVIALPKTPVNPQRSTAIFICNSAFFILFPRLKVGIYWVLCRTECEVPIFILKMENRLNYLLVFLFEKTHLHFYQLITFVFLKKGHTVF
jgi:hypothetical protein